MKKFLFTAFLVTASILYAVENKGVSVQVVLNSGVTQKAQFLGITQDLSLIHI